MQVRTKLYISLSAAILFAIAVIVFFINGNPLINIFVSSC